MRPILVGIDGSPAAERALRWALDEATTRGCPLHVVHVWDYEPLTDWTMTTEQDVRARSEALIDDALRVASVGRLRFPEIVWHSLRGVPSEVLEKEGRDAALLVVASNTGHRLRKIVLGSTSTDLVRHATVPVVVIPAQEAPQDDRSVPEAHEVGHAADHG